MALKILGVYLRGSSKPLQILHFSGQRKIIYYFKNMYILTFMTMINPVYRRDFV